MLLVLQEQLAQRLAPHRDALVRLQDHQGLDTIIRILQALPQQRALQAQRLVPQLDILAIQMRADLGHQHRCDAAADRRFRILVAAHLVGHLHRSRLRLDGHLLPRDSRLHAALLLVKGFAQEADAACDDLEVLVAEKALKQTVVVQAKDLRRVADEKSRQRTDDPEPNPAVAVAMGTAPPQQLGKGIGKQRRKLLEPCTLLCAQCGRVQALQRSPLRSSHVSVPEPHQSAQDHEASLHKLRLPRLIGLVDWALENRGYLGVKGRADPHQGGGFLRVDGDDAHGVDARSDRRGAEP
mmetsp:Transcript_756/g.3106  ORF Transcript_756/g.3106 Transcript_756/m.3106 type:complete len:296 (-) Transcript_756:2034-2921(-)|eukprot:scaffold1696_cov258-Pinguiococcus_pyrenoidosus.AAC.7